MILPFFSSPDVDFIARTAIGHAAMGTSVGRLLAARALAFEHRFVAAVVDAGVVDVARTWNANLPPELLALLEAGDRDTFNAAISAGPADPERERTFAFRAKPYGGTTPYDVFAAVQSFTLDGLIEKITTPLLITDPDGEQFFPGQPKELYDRLPGEKQIVRFTREQGADFHCQPMARALTGMVMTDFLADHLK